MNDDLQQLLKVLHLKHMPVILDREIERAKKESMAYDEFLTRILRCEYNDQQARYTQARVARAHLPEKWSLDSFPWDLQPGVDRRQIRDLAQLEFIRTGTNLVFVGPTGVGKTGLAIRLLLKAMQAGYPGYFLKAQDLFDELYSSLADRSSRKLLDRMTRYDALLIDEMGYLTLQPAQTNLFFKLMEERYTKRKATIITTNLEYEEWHRFLNNPALTEALLSRICHRCITLPIHGPSLRAPAAAA